MKKNYVMIIFILILIFIPMMQVRAACNPGDHGYPHCFTPGYSPTPTASAPTSTPTQKPTPSDDKKYWDNLPGENELVCNHLMTERLAKLLGKIYRTIIMLALVGVVVLGMMDFVKATGSDNADEMKKAWKRFLNRLIIAVLLVMLPTLLEFIFTLFGNSDMKNCLNYF